MFKRILKSVCLISRIHYAAWAVGDDDVGVTEHGTQFPVDRKQYSDEGLQTDQELKKVTRESSEQTDELRIFAVDASPALSAAELFSFEEPHGNLQEPRLNIKNTWIIYVLSAIGIWLLLSYGYIIGRITHGVGNDMCGHWYIKVPGLRLNPGKGVPPF